jgi:hypothetical protein
VLLGPPFDRRRRFVLSAQTLGSRTRPAATGPARAGRLRPDHPWPGDADHLGEAALLQPGAELAATAIISIGQHAPVRHAPGTCLADEGPGQFPFLAEPDIWGMSTC